MLVLRAAVGFLILTVLLVVPIPWVPFGARSALSLSAMAALLIGLYFFGHWVMERVSPAPHEPFASQPTGRSKPRKAA